jgi:hypothetical protein
VPPRQDLLTEILHPVLDTYLNSEVGVTGCHSYGLARECCEYDVIVVSAESRPKASVKFGNTYVDLIFMSEKEVLGPSDPEVAVSLSSVVPVRDNSLTFSTSSSTARAVLQENLKKCAETRLARSLKALVRADQALSKNDVADANFWLTAGGYEFGYAWLYSSGATPAPSHILWQLRNHVNRGSEGYVAFSKAVGLEVASRKECGERLEAIAIVQDAISASETTEPEGMDSVSARTSFEIVRSKAECLTREIMHVDCYAFLGLAMYTTVPRLSALQSKSAEADLEQAGLVASLLEGDKKLIGERVVDSLGLTRPATSIEKGIKALRDEISNLAKQI